MAFVDRSDAVTDPELQAIHRDGAACGREIGVAEIAQLMLEARPGAERRSEHFGIGAYGKGFGCPGESACEDDKLIGAIPLGKAPHIPSRLSAVLARAEPD